MWLLLEEKSLLRDRKKAHSKETNVSKSHSKLTTPPISTISCEIENIIVVHICNFCSSMLLLTITCLKRTSKFGLKNNIEASNFGMTL